MLILLYSTRDGYSLDSYMEKLEEARGKGRLDWYRKTVYFYDTPIEDATFIKISSFEDFRLLRDILGEELILRSKEYSESFTDALSFFVDSDMEVVEIYDDCRE